VKRREFEVLEQKTRPTTGEPAPEERVEHLVALGHALSDPIRVRMLGMMAVGRGCCDFADLGVPASDEDAGICVCELEDLFGMGQSKVSYHMRKLKDAGLVREEKRGKWSFYSLDRQAADALLSDAMTHFMFSSVERGQGASCC
jgi:ArsR family transcriptional regulator, arsenate/arsenite/antimonite-responsive transcriptional repressor